MRFAKIVSMLVVCAAATIVVSVIAHASVDSKKVIAQDLLPPYNLQGFTTDVTGLIPYACDVWVTNMRTHESATTTSYPEDGYYIIDVQHAWPSAFIVGDRVNVTATNFSALLIGWNEQPIPGGGSMWMDVILDGTWDGIPEFPMVIVPVMGMMALFVVVGLRRKGREQ